MGREAEDSWGGEEEPETEPKNRRACAHQPAGRLCNQKGVQDLASTMQVGFQALFFLWSQQPAHHVRALKVKLPRE